MKLSAGRYLADVLGQLVLLHRYAETGDAETPDGKILRGLYWAWAVPTRQLTEAEYSCGVLDRSADVRLLDEDGDPVWSEWMDQGNLHRTKREALADAETALAAWSKS